MPKTYNDLYLETRRVFKDHGIEAFNLEARLVVAHAANKSTEAFFRDLRLYSSDETETKVRELVARRLEGEPVAYVTGTWEFYGLPLIIEPSVLIPRVDSEVLAETAIDTLMGRKMDARVLDLCCGSGCLGCAIAYELPAARVVMADINPEALAVSKKNVALNGLGHRVICVEADALAPPPMMMGSYDLIVCNPPYIPSGDIAGLDKSVREFEPLLALDGGEDGLDFYRAVVRHWKPLLREGATLLFEVGVGQAEAVKQIMRLGGFRAVAGVYDTLGIERVISAKA